MAQDTSGPAFPCPAPTVNGNGDFIYGDSAGMTLRDWFAGQSIAGTRPGCRVPDSEVLEHARWAYRMADAMLKAREA